jgi:hypothetical protein
MPLSKNRTDREFNKFALDQEGRTAVNVIVRPPALDDISGPSNLLLNGNTTVLINEGQATGAVAGVLSSEGGLAPIIYSIEQDLSDSFDISGNELITTKILDASLTPVLNVAVRATDFNGRFTITNFTLNVQPAGGFQNSLSFEFRGNSYINIPSNDYAGDAPMSWWAWVKYDGKPSSIEYLFNSANGINASGITLGLLSGSNDVGFTVRRSNGNLKDYRYVLPVDYNYGLWHLYGFVVQNNLIQFWLDGALQTVSAVSFDQNTAGVDPTGVNTFLGANSNGTAEFFNGKMSGIVYSNVAIQPSQWIQLYNAGVQPDVSTVLPPSDYEYEYRATASASAPNEPIINIPDQKDGLDAVGLNLFASSDVPIAYQNTVSTEFDGATNYLVGSGGGNSDIDFTLAKTFIFWIKRTTPLGTDILFSNRPSVAIDNGWSFYFDTNAANRIYWEMESTGGLDQRARWDLGASSIDSWTHVVITMPSNVGGFDVNNINCYVNGSIVSRSNQDNDLAAIPTMSNNISIGGGTGGGSLLAARINEIAVVDAELTALQAQEAYNLGMPIDLRRTTFGADLRQRWRMGNNNGFGATQTDDVSGKQVVMINFDSAFYVGDTPP